MGLANKTQYVPRCLNGILVATILLIQFIWKFGQNHPRCPNESIKSWWLWKKLPL